MKKTMNKKYQILNHYKGLKAILFVMLLCLSFGEAVAQSLRINLTVNSRPSAYLAEWYRPQNGLVVLTTMKGEEMDQTYIRFETEIYNMDEQLVYTLPVTNSSPIALSGNVMTFPLSDVLQLQNGHFADSRMTNSFARGGKLPADKYTIRLRIWHGMEDFQIAEWTPPKVFLISSYQLPTLIAPANEQELDMNKARSVITFRWTPLAPSMGQSVASYRVQIWRVLPNQTPMQTMRSTPPIEDRLVKGITQYIWQPRLSMMDDDPVETNQFIWSVQTLDEKDMPVETTDSSMNGYSEPATFTIVNEENKARVVTGNKEKENEN